MKHLILAVIILIVPLSVGPVFAQTATPTQEAQSVELMGEDDRLPFMQTEQAPRMAEPSSGGLLVKTLGAMLVIVGLIFAGAWLARKFGLGNQSAGDATDEFGLFVTKTISLGTGKTLSTVRFGERTLLVGATPQSIALLAEETRRSDAKMAVSRSVAEMLGDENNEFEAEFLAAEQKIAELDGGQIS